ncbi:MAG: sporulation transcription factor Spo0A [Peptococcaceae bacterium]|jgi:two-component system response regulator (stage 0 sporulation protein A)|nr:sporulation transcription factor Spo0A [Peptococcaceae bacterium]
MMASIRAVLIDHSPSVRGEIEHALRQKDGIKIIGSVGDGASALEILQTESVDVVITDLILSGLDGFSFIEAIHHQKLMKKPKVIVLTALTQDELIRRSLSLGVDYYMLKPCDPVVLYQRIVELLSHHQEPPPLRCQNSEYAAPNSFDERISNILLSVGIPAHIKGYHFLRNAIKNVVDNPNLINKITKELYPMVALHFHSSPTKVERAIRHAIEVAWSREKIENINDLFGIKIYRKNEKPTNSEFIALIADRFAIWH